MPTYVTKYYFVITKNSIFKIYRKIKKKKSGINIDGFGKEIIKDETKKEEIPSNLIISKMGATTKPKKETNFASINEYKPTGNLVYTNDMFANMNKKIENKK